MIANYHTHTWRCHHASGEEEAYVQAAKQAGMQVLGFSDHSPYAFPQGYHSSFRMEPELLGDYAQTIRALEKRHRGELEIHLGVECEFYPKHFDDTLAMLRDNGVEYMILGQHFLDNEYDAEYSGQRTTWEEDLAKYCAQSMEAMQTGLFTYFAHPDLIHFLGNGRVYKAHMRRLCQEAKACGLPLEINMEGLRRERWYPNPLFLEAAGEENCTMILGCDAHYPAALNEPETEKAGRQLAQAFGLTILDTVRLKSIL